MTDITLAQALGGMIAIPQFFVWRLVWSATKNKYLKTPCFADGSVYIMEAKDPANWKTYDEAVAILASLEGNGTQYALGFYLTADLGYWFFDLDGCLNKETGELSPEADYAMKALPGALCEWSSSGKGLHFIGRGAVPPHGCTYKAANLEFYTEGRGIAFGLSGMATGCADTDHTNAVQVICNHWFPPVPEAVHGSGPRPEWRGPTDDAELLRRAMASKSDANRLGYKASFEDLWTRNVPVLAKFYPPSDAGSDFGESEADGALAMQLAFWTGCDADRIERLMLQSALKRDKWDKVNHETYLRELTISRACASVSRVLIDEDKVQKLDVAVTPEQMAASDDWLGRVVNADEPTLRNVVIPAIAADRTIEMLDRERLALLVKERLGVFQIPATIGQCRKMVSMQKVDTVETDIGVPAFATAHLYIENGDLFFDTATATEKTYATFRANYNREMPSKPNGDKEDAAKWCLERWGMRTVFDTMYVPCNEPIFTYQGRKHANLYTPASLPEVTEYTTAGVTGIQTFASLLERFCGGRQDVYGTLLAWMAFNVQNPGNKVRWAPILKGVQGDGKSLITSVMAAAMGERNVSSVGPSVVMNQGGFTDWAHGACVIGMEELKMEGKNRYAMANAFKDNVTNSRVTINRKGRGLLPIINISNFIAYTNFTDAVPLEDNDRRWFVVFSPYRTIHDLLAANGLTTVDELGRTFDAVWHAVHKCPGELRKWLLEMPVPESFKPDGHAPDTPEKASMRASGEDETHSIARQVIATGAHGVSVEALSTACLSKAIERVYLTEGIETPKTTKLTKMLTDLGYMSHGLVKWNGYPHRVWVLSTMSNEQVRYHLDTTVTG